MIGYKYILTAFHRPGTPTIDKFFDKIVVPSGYPLFAWNGQIYAINYESEPATYHELKLPKTYELERSQS